MSEIKSVQALMQLRSLVWEIGSRRRRQLGGLLALMLTSSVAEVITLAAAVPFLAIISGQSGGGGHQLFARLAWGLGFTGMRQRLLLITLGFGAVVLVATGLRLTCQYLSARLAAVIGTELSSRIYASHLLQPYPEQLAQRREGSRLVANITIFANQASGTIYQLLQLLLALFLVVGLLTAGLIADWRVTLAAIAVVGLTYGLVNSTNLPRLRRHGRETSQSTQLLSRTLEEAIHRSKSIILDGSASAQLEQFRQLDQTMRRGRSRVQFLSTYPKTLAEGVILIAIAAVGFWSVMRSGDRINTMIPLLGTLALGAQKLLPAMQMVYASWAGIVSNAPAVEQVLSMMGGEAQQHQALTPLPLRQALQLEHVQYRHRKGKRRVLEDVGLTINAGDVVGLIGPSGAGKSTLADILMGLLPPQQGVVRVDGVGLHVGEPQAWLAPRWQRSIAYVASAVYLLPASVADNIHCRVDLPLAGERVRWAARLAALASFIDSLPQGYDTRIGSGGLAISHGQRQRIGLARALMQQRPVLVLDEATAALDLDTEAQILTRLRQLQPALTVVLITHRSESLVHCDRVYRLLDGRLRAEACA